MKITRIFEFDAGHRIPNHHSLCKNLHGHRYKLEITLTGKILQDSGTRFEGMVLDFSDIKTIVQQSLIQKLDHSFIVFSGDLDLIAFLKSSDSRFIVLQEIPTVENIVRFCWETLMPEIKKTYNDSLCLKQLKLWETPNCFVVYEGE